jgi:F-type H+-transporting ATPase subunit b
MRSSQQMSGVGVKQRFQCYGSHAADSNAGLKGLLNPRSVRNLALLIALGIMICLAAFSQTSGPSQAGVSSAANVPAKTNESKEAAGEDETAQFRHSSSVQMISKITGLSLDQAYWLAILLNFAIIAGLIAWFSKKNLPAMFRSRTALIQKSLEEARKASEDANRRLSEIESRLGRLGDEISQMKASSEKEAAAEEERIKAAAEEDARRIVQSAEQEIASAAKSARRELTAYAADLAVSLATRQIRVDTPTDQALVRRFAQQLSEDGAGKKDVEKEN